MSKPLIPLIYHPSSVIIVDDSESFLNSLSLRLPDNVPYCLCASPLEALKLIQENEKQAVLEPGKILTNSFDYLDHRNQASTLKVDYGKFSVSLTNPKRFNKFSCAIVDYTMPGMNGIDFLKQIKNVTLEKIMLTGTADEKMALEAHNQDIVSVFYLKNSSNVFNELVEKLTELQHRYFVQLSERFVGLIENYQAIFCNADFLTLFNQLCSKHHVAEHYVKDHDGSLLLVSSAGDAFDMCFYPAHEINELALMAKDSKLSDDLVSPLEARVAVPVGIRDWLHLAKKEAPTITEKLHKVPGADGFYYSWHSLGNLIERNKEFVSFDYFMRNLWPNY